MTLITMNQMKTLRVNRKWHQTVMKLLLGKDMCGSCLCSDEDLTHWDSSFVLQLDETEVECTLKNVMMYTFGSSILNIISTSKFCQKCIDIILKAYLLLHEIQQNYRHIQKRLTEVSTQMKWTQHLNETGSLNEFNVNDLVDSCNNLTSNTMAMEKKMYRITLNDESLKHKLIQDPKMHKYLIKKKNIKDTKLPAGITVKRIQTDIEIADFEPHELLELNWAEDTDYDSAIPNSHVPKTVLHSNEALIMDLMEKAKNVNHKIYNNSFNQHEILDRLPDSLSVNLISRPINGLANKTDFMAQDSLETKWSEKQKQTKQFIKIPVKKLNFNEGLTVKFIPKHKMCQLQESMTDVAPYELLELNWNEETENGLQNVEPDINEKHNIDLTKWLEDQGMSTIGSNKDSINAESMNIQEIAENANNSLTSENKNALDKSGCHDIINVDEIKSEKFEIQGDGSDFNVNVEIEPVNESHENKTDIRCALCNSLFDDFNAYTNHYKTHNIIESAKCYMCPMQFAVIELLSEHLLSAHLQNISYCNVCFAMLSQDKLAEHMSIYHAKIVEVINAPNVKNEESTVLRLSDFCKKCKQPLNTSSEPHVCVEARSRCKECKHGCIHERYLASYRDQLRAKPEIFKCPDCDYQYKTKREIIQHANKVHLENKPHVCKQCNLGFLLKTSLARHNNLYHARCETCRRVFKDTDTMNKHKCSSGPRNNYKCELCGQGFTETKYEQHKQTALLAPDTCLICHQPIPIKCNMSRHLLDLHNLSLKKGLDRIVYECVICEVDFNDMADYSKHAWVHTGVHECHICAKRFSSRVLYDTHYKMHVTAQKLKCYICNEQQTDKHAYSQHLQTHGDYGKCTVCSKFVKHESINEHMKEHETTGNKFQCPHCSLVSSSASQSEVHVNRFHLQTRPYQCDVCKKRFYSKHLMRTHISKHYGKEKCTLCDRKFAKKWYLEMHMKVHENTTASNF